jgi:hypothetical protein
MTEQNINTWKNLNGGKKIIGLVYIILGLISSEDIQKELNISLENG